MTLEELEALTKEEKKNMPEWMRNRPSSLRWNIRPERLIVYNFGSKDPANNLKVRMSVGAFQKDEKWFFAAAYTAPTPNP